MDVAELSLSLSLPLPSPLSHSQESAAMTCYIVLKPAFIELPQQEVTFSTKPYLNAL